MKLGLVVGVLLAAHAAHADEYPSTYVDRPLNLLPGMTSLDVNEQVSSFPKETFGHQTPDISVFHAVGPVELGAELGDYAVLHVSLTTHTFPESIEISGLSGVPQPDNSLHVAQAVSAGHRFHVVPGALSIRAVAGVTVSENRLRDAASMLEWTQVLATYADASIELQILPHQLALFAEGFVDVPITNWGGPTFDSSVGAGGGFIITLGTWDIYVSGGARDLTGYHLPYLYGGFTKRWGG